LRLKLLIISGLPGNSWSIEFHNFSIKWGHQANDPFDEKQKRRFLSPEKKYQIFLESQTGKTPVGEILRREGMYSTDLVRIRKHVKEGALERLSARPGPKRKTVPREDYEALKRELEDKERALADQAVELAILRKKTNGGSWER
jgi:transposase-like protein